MSKENKEENKTMKWIGIISSFAVAIVGMVILLYNLIAIMGFLLCAIIIIAVNYKRIERVTKTRLNVKIEGK
jgi:hypothetical protein